MFEGFAGWVIGVQAITTAKPKTRIVSQDLLDGIRVCQIGPRIVGEIMD